MLHFVGAGPGAEDLITLRGARLLEEADQVIYAGSLVNPALLRRCKAGCRILDSARVSSFCAAAASLCAEYTLPGLSQTLILTRMAGRTPVPERESVELLAAHGSSMALFLSAGMLEELQERLLAGTYSESTPAALVYKASWPEEKTLRCTLGSLAQTAREAGITKTALVLVGDFLNGRPERSRLYDPAFTTGYREGTEHAD